MKIKKLSDEGFDQAKCLRVVQAKYPKVEMVDAWRYVAIDEKCRLHYVETMNTKKAIITKDILLEIK